MKNSKKLLSLLLAVAMLASVFTVMSSAAAFITGPETEGYINIKYSVEKADSVPANTAAGSEAYTADNIYAVSVWAKCNHAIDTFNAPIHFDKTLFAPITLVAEGLTFPVGAELGVDTYYTDMEGDSTLYAIEMGDYMNNTGMYKASGATATTKALAKCIGLGNPNSESVGLTAQYVTPDHPNYVRWNEGLPANTGIVFAQLDVSVTTKAAYLNTVSGITHSTDYVRMFTIYFETLPGVTDADVVGAEFGCYTDTCFGVDGTTDEYLSYYTSESTAIHANPTKNVVGNATIVETSILNPLKNQIKFGVNEDGTSDGTFDYRMLAVITGADFAATFTDVDTAKGMIKEMGYVHAITDDGSVIDMATARGVVNGTAAEGYTLTKVNYLSTSISEGNYVMSLFIDNIPAADKDNTVSAIAYIKTADAIYFYPVVASAQFSGLYNTYYSQAFPA